MANSKNNTWLIVVIILAIINLIIVGVIINMVFFAEDQKDTSDITNNSSSTGLIIGNINAKVTIIEYSDFECPFCKRFYNDAYKQIKSEYIDTGKVKIVFKHFPLTNIHANALPAAIAVECANEQGKGVEMHNRVYETTALSNENLKSYAKEFGLNTEKFNTCLDTQKYKDKVLADQKEGVAAGVTGTPTLIIGSQKVVGAQPFANFKTAIDAELAKN